MNVPWKRIEQQGAGIRAEGEVAADQLRGMVRSGRAVDQRALAGETRFPHDAFELDGLVLGFRVAVKRVGRAAHDDDQVALFEQDRRLAGHDPDKTAAFVREMKPRDVLERRYPDAPWRREGRPEIERAGEAHVGKNVAEQVH